MLADGTASGRRRNPGDASSAVIVGAGVFGSALAYRLSRSDWDVTLVEKNAPGHARSPSGGESRLLRCSHGIDATYARLAWRARDHWRELEAESGRSLFLETGLTYLAHRDDGWEARSASVLRQEGIPAERLTPEQAAALFPSLETADLSHVLFEPAAGVLRARDAVQVLAEGAKRHGARLEVGMAYPAADGVRIGDRQLCGDVVVWACGPWLASLFPEVVDLQVTRQEVFFFGGDSGWATPPVPAWIDQDAEIYGLGDLDGRGFKVALDADGDAFDPEASERLPSAAKLAEARAYLSMRFPSLADAPSIGSRVCCYASTTDQEFIVDRVPGVPGQWILGGDSGHGFKHAPALSEHLQRVLDGRETTNERWRIAPQDQRVVTRETALR